MTTITQTAIGNDGIHTLLPREQMIAPARKLRDIYAITPGAPIVHREFGYFCLERWYGEGLERGDNLAEVFGYDPPGDYDIGDLGWCEAAFCPTFDKIVLETRGEHEVIQDPQGRSLLVFTGRRTGFMPTFLDHPVKDMATWEEKCAWRMRADTPERWNGFDEKMASARAAAGEGKVIVQRIGAGCMYLRSLFGPEEIMYAFHDQPELIHACMKTWFELADAVTARHQEHVTFDMVFLAEDICYNHGLLWSPATIKEFLFPYYQQLLANIRRRQLDQSRHLYVQVDSDGYAVEAIPLFREAVRMDVMSPFEVASGCDVVAIGRDYPFLAISGGIDKRVLAQGKHEIDRMVERIIPAMRERGGYYPTCDHGVPEEVSLDNYRHYRTRCIELGG
ncbi:MAG: uroporphyrinogen decarboxylase family protein [Capsulimonadaceae bacterium]|nr:uroporphyrinogen decarboxylase family protein [Capsulimonadaceae bacterium]